MWTLRRCAWPARMCWRTGWRPTPREKAGSWGRRARWPRRWLASSAPPGGIVRLHQHPYKDIFILEAGAATYTVGSEALEAHAGQIIIVPASTPHKFVNTGQTQLRQVDIHLSPEYITEWLES